MRFLFLALLVSCSSSSLKFKFTSSKNHVALQNDESLRVAKIELSSASPKVFVSGMDSTSITVKLFDENGYLLTQVAAADLTLSSSESIEAKPFALKQGVYKADLLPRVNSPDIHLQVDWKGLVQSQVIVLEATTTPIKDGLLPINREFIESKSHGEIMVGRGSRFPASGSEEFNFVNVGENKIISGPSSSRTFNFEYPEHARQNMAMQIDDSPSENSSHVLHSYFMFFPRKQLPIMVQLAGTMEVTLPNGEKMIFDKETKEIIGGVFKEGPIAKKSYPDLKYSGRGVMLRANGRGQSPQLAQNEKEKIDLEHGTFGSAEVLIVNGVTGQKCRRPKADFWDDLEVSPIEFKFARDEDFEIYLQIKCGFGLPKF